MALADIVRKSNKLALGKFDTRPGIGPPITDSVDTIRQILLDAGWQDHDSIKATGSFSFPLGFPIDMAHGGGVDITNRLAAIVQKRGAGGRVIFQFYDRSNGESDPTAYDAGTLTQVIGVRVGPNNGATAGNLAEKLTSALGIFIVGIVNDGGGNPVGLSLLSVLAGTQGNGWLLDGNGAFSTGSGATEGGGWILRSNSQQQADLDAGTSPASANTTRTTLTLRDGAPGQHGLQIRVQVDGLPAFDFYAAQGDWECWANPFVARFQSSSPFHAGDVFVFNAFLWVGSVCLPSELDLNPVGFIRYGFAVPFTLGIGNAFATASTVAGTKVSLAGNFGQNLSSWAFYHAQNGIPLLTRMGKSILLPAIAMMLVTPPEASLSDEGRFVGYEWDAFIETSYHAPGTLIVQGGEPYRAFSVQGSGVIGTLWVRWPVRPPDSGVTEPDPLPVLTGTCDRFGVGVTRLTGSPFTSELVGRVIYIGGRPFKVDTVLDADHLILAGADTTVLTGAAFHT